MEKSIVYKSAVLAALSALALTGCQDEDFGFEAKDIAYRTQFEKAFGKIDPNHDWSMAAYVRAVVTGMEDGTIELLYSDPIAGKPVIIAKRPVVNGEAEFNFNVVKGTKRVFARIKNAQGYYSLNRYFDILDNEVYIANSSTRAGGNTFTGTSRVTQGETYSLVCPQLIDWTKKDNFYLETSGMAAADDYIDGFYADKTNHQNITGKDDFFYNGEFTNLIRLNDVISTEDERPWWYVSEIAPFFTEIDGVPACFDERQNHVKLMKEGSNPKLQKDLVFEMESNSPFYLDYFFEGTDFINDFGYFYFTGDNPTREQFMTMKKYVLVNDFAGNEIDSELKYATTYVNSTTDPIRWNLLGIQGNYNGNTPGYGIAGLDCADQSSWDNKVVGTRIPLTYFGTDGTSAGTYEFPKGTKIGIFLIGRGNGRDNMIITSIAKLNQDLYNEMPHAASFQIGDKVVFAMEDQHTGSDKDINDAMFIAHGNFNKTYIPNIIPTVEPEAPTWIMACEDLGGSFDYDFNDLVFGLRVTDLGDNTSNLDLIPLAAGGTLDAKIEYDGYVFGEIHDLVKSGAPTTTPINVTAGQTAVKGQTVRLASGISSETDIEQIAGQVKIIVTKGTTETNNNEDGVNKYNIGYRYVEDSPVATDVVPQVLLLPAGWEWPSERTLITKIYPDFENWVANQKDPDSQTWVTRKADGATNLVHNPVLPVTPSTDPEVTPGEGGGETPVTPGTDEWNITITGEPVMGMGTSQTITISVEGLVDYTNVECGTYSTNVITATKVNNTQYTIAGATAQARGVARFYVKVPGDATHATTRKVFEITVGAAVPEFYFYTKENNENVRITSGALTLPVKPTDAGVELYIEAITNKSDGGAITWHSNDEDVVKVVNNQLQRVACGTVTITATHAAVDNGNNTFSELSKSIELTIERLDPVFTVNISECSLSVGGTQAFTINHQSGEQTAYTQKSNNTTVATVPDEGLYGNHTITAVGNGTATVTITHAETDFYKSKSQTISVSVLALSNLSANNITLGCNKTLTLVRGVHYNSLSDGDITVSIEGSAATVNGTQITTGSVSNSENVTVTITQDATSTYAGSSCQFTLTVDPNAKDPATISLTGGEKNVTIAATENSTLFTINESDYTAGSSTGALSFESSDPSVFTLNKEGDVLTLTRVTKSNKEAYVKIVQAADTDHDAGYVNYVKVSVEKVPTINVTNTTITIPCTTVNGEWDSNYLYGATIWKADLSAYEVSGNVSASVEMITNTGSFIINKFCSGKNWEGQQTETTFGSTFVANAFNNGCIYIAVNNPYETMSMKITFTAE